MSSGKIFHFKLIAGMKFFPKDTDPTATRIGVAWEWLSSPVTVAVDNNLRCCETSANCF